MFTQHEFKLEIFMAVVTLALVLEASKDRYATWSLRHMSEDVKVDIEKQHRHLSIF